MKVNAMSITVKAFVCGTTISILFHFNMFACLFIYGSTLPLVTADAIEAEKKKTNLLVTETNTASKKKPHSFTIWKY